MREWRDSENPEAFEGCGGGGVEVDVTSLDRLGSYRAAKVWSAGEILDWLIRWS